MAKSRSSKNKATAKKRAAKVAAAMADAGAGAAAPPAGGATLTAGVPNTPTGIVVDYEGPEETDLPVGALQDAQLVALIKQVLGRGKATFLFVGDGHFLLRVCGP